VFLITPKLFWRYINETLNKRKKEAEKAQDIIEKYTLKYIEWLHLSKVDPIMHKIKDQLENLRKDELEKIYNNHLKHLNDLDKQQFNDVTYSIVNKISQNLILSIKQNAANKKNNEELKTYIDHLSSIFENKK